MVGLGSLPAAQKWTTGEMTAATLQASGTRGGIFIVWWGSTCLVPASYGTPNLGVTLCTNF